MLKVRPDFSQLKPTVYESHHYPSLTLESPRRATKSFERRCIGKLP
jgi:hypothetical protein